MGSLSRAVTFPNDKCLFNYQNAVNMTSALVSYNMGNLTMTNPVPFVAEESGYNSAYKLFVTGKGTPGSTIKLYSNGTYVGVTIVDSEGNYKVYSNDSVKNGYYDLTVSQTPVGGVESAQIDAPDVAISDYCERLVAPVFTGATMPFRAWITNEAWTYFAGIDLDSSENIYLCGRVYDTTKFDAFTITDSVTGQNYKEMGAVLKLNPAGVIQWAKSFPAFYIEGALRRTCCETLRNS